MKQINKYGLFLRKVIFPLLERVYGTKILKNLSFLARSQSFSKNRLISYQNERLQKIVMHAYSDVPYYRELFDNLNIDPKDIKSKEDLKRIPFLSKKLVRRNKDSLRAEGFKGRSYPKSTSGSTGQPTIFYQTKDDFSWIWAGHFRAWSWAGFEPGDKYVKLSITEENKSWKKKLQNIIFRCKFIRVYDMGDENLGKYAAEIVSYGPKLIYGYSSSLNAIAEYMLKNNIRCEVAAVITTGDKLMPLYSKNIKKAFGARIFDEFGCGGEGLYVAAQCEAGVYHINDELMIVEEDRGEIVITSFNNYAMPLLRYKSNDMVKFGGACKCGKTISTIRSLEGRTNEFVRTRSGVMLNSQFFEYIMEVVPGIMQFKIVQLDYDTIKIFLRCSREYSRDASEERITGYILKSAKVKINILYEYVRSFNGKSARKFKPIESKIR